MVIRRKKLLITLGIAAVLLVVVVILAITRTNVEHYRPQILSYLETNTGKPVEVGRLSITYFPITLHIEDFGVRNPPLFPAGYIVKVGRIDAELSWTALLRQNVTVKSLTLTDAVIHLTSDPDGPWNFENPQSQNSKNTFPLTLIPRMEIIRGELIASNLLPSDAQGPIFFEAHNVSSLLKDVDLAAITNPTSSSMNGSGTLKAGLLKLGDVVATNFTSKVQLQARRASVADAKAIVYGGNAEGDLIFDLSGSNPKLNVDAQFKKVNMAQLVAAFPNGAGKLSGQLEGNLKLFGEVEHTLRPFAAMRGAGKIIVRNGEVPSLKLNANVMKLAHFNDLGPAKENPSAFSYISTDMELANLRISSHTIDVDGYGVDVDGSGSVSVSGSDDLDYKAIASITTKQGFFTNTFAKFAGATLKDGKLSFPFHISGTIENPVFAKGKTN